jgi:hypothetical protein
MCSTLGPATFDDDASMGGLNHGTIRSLCSGVRPSSATTRRVSRKADHGRKTALGTKVILRLVMIGSDGKKGRKIHRVLFSMYTFRPALADAECQGLRIDASRVSALTAYVNLRGSLGDW